MPEPIEWIQRTISYCKEGLCQRMNQLMEEGLSQRKAAKVMEAECQGKWKAKTIRINFCKFNSQNEEGLRKEEYEITEAMQFAVVAISQLERIRDDDPKRQQALNRVVAWIEKHRNGYKGA